MQFLVESIALSTLGGIIGVLLGMGGTWLAISRLEMPYPQIGYNELRLIKKTDIKLLLECWGKPKAHLKPRELHGETWKSLIARRQTTLF